LQAELKLAYHQEDQRETEGETGRWIRTAKMTQARKQRRAALGPKRAVKKQIMMKQTERSRKQLESNSTGRRSKHIGARGRVVHPFVLRTRTVRLSLPFAFAVATPSAVVHNQTLRSDSYGYWKRSSCKLRISFFLGGSPQTPPKNVLILK